ncbi:hypothetical protein SAY87_004064 [Trapa incisa]|uniref:Amino acid transporter transmembrane domain-containing protein n=1 Tax=Trapa incisa TaxID=236973 RepID=A0AAN7JNB4_9MYRT|nr:hypothetical protein SAY87_004064 [Trapa incisa]
MLPSRLPGVFSNSMPRSNRMTNVDSTSAQREMGGEGIEEEGVDDPNSSLIPSFDSSDSLLIRTGTKWTAVAHIISAVIGAGVLSLAWSVAQLGWIIGPLCIILFAAMTLVSSALLADCYRHPNPEHGPIRNRSFMDATKLYMGKKHQLVLGVMAQVSLYGAPIAYTITAASSVRAILKAICYHWEGHQAPCEYGDSFSMLLFGLIQILVSQMPDFHSMRWLSVSATVMSFSYSFIGLGLGLAKVIENGTIKGSMTGVPGSDLSSKLMAAFTALGDIAYSYPFALILLEIEVQPLPLTFSFSSNLNR